MANTSNDRRLMDILAQGRTEDPATQHVLNWISIWDGIEGFRTLRFAMQLEEAVLTPSQKMGRVMKDETSDIWNGRVLYEKHAPHDVMFALERRPLHLLALHHGSAGPQIMSELLAGPTRYRVSTGVLVADGLGRLPIHIAVMNQSEFAGKMTEAVLAQERLMTVRHRDFRGRYPLHYAAINSCADAGEIVRQLAKLNPAAARVEDKDAFLPMELAFLSTSPTVGMVTASITTAFPDGALRDPDGFGNMLHRACSHEIVLKNRQAVSIVKALLAFHPETVKLPDHEGKLALHRVAGTRAPQALDIAELLSEQHPDGIWVQDQNRETPLHIAARANNKPIVRALVQRSKLQAQHTRNKYGQYPKDLTKNLEVIKLLVAKSNPKTGWLNATFLVLSSLSYVAVTVLLLMDYWEKHQQALKDLSTSSSDAERQVYFEWCRGCGFTSHAFYLIMCTVFYGSSVLVYFMILFSTLFMSRPRQDQQSGLFGRHELIAEALFNTSSLLLAKNLERFGVLFPLATIHLTAVLQHEDLYWIEYGPPSSPWPSIRVVGIFLPMLMSAHTSVCLDLSKHKAMDFHLSLTKYIRLSHFEYPTLFLFRVSEMLVRVFVTSFAWFGFNACSYCHDEECSCTFRYYALPALSFQFIMILVLTSSYEFWVSLCTRAPVSIWSMKDVIFNLHFAKTVCNMMGTFFSQGGGELTGHNQFLHPFLGEVGLYESIIMVVLQVLTNLIIIYAASLTGIYGSSEEELRDAAQNMQGMYSTTLRLVIFILVNSGTFLQIVLCYQRYQYWRTTALSIHEMAKKVKRKEISQKIPSLTVRVLENYGFPLYQLEEMADGRGMDVLESAKRKAKNSEFKGNAATLEDEEEEEEVIDEAEQANRLQRKLESIKQMRSELGVTEWGQGEGDEEQDEDEGVAPDSHVILTPTNLHVIGVVEGTCTIRFQVPCPQGFNEQDYWNSITHYQIKLNNVGYMRQKLPINRAGNTKFEAQIKLNKGENEIAVRVIAVGEKDRWSSYSSTIHTTGPTENEMRKSRLGKYMQRPIQTLVNTAFGGMFGKASPNKSPLARRSDSDVSQESDSEDSVVGAAGPPESPKLRKMPSVEIVSEHDAPEDAPLAPKVVTRASNKHSVNRVLQEEEQKRLELQIDKARGPSEEVRRRYEEERYCSFSLEALTPPEAAGQVHPLLLGENKFVHDPAAGPDSASSIIHAYLRRLQIIRTGGRSVIIVRGDNGREIFCDKDVQEAAYSEDIISFPESATSYKIVFKERQRKKPIEKGGFEQDAHALELVMILAEKPKEYLSSGIVQRAQLMRQLKADLATALRTQVERFEIVSMVAHQRTVEIRFLILPPSRSDETQEPKLLAAELSEQIANPESAVRKLYTIRNASSLTVQIAYGDEDALRSGQESVRSSFHGSANFSQEIHVAAELRDLSPKGSSHPPNIGIGSPPPRGNSSQHAVMSIHEGIEEAHHWSQQAKIWTQGPPQHGPELHEPYAFTTQEPSGPHPLKTMEGRLASFAKWPHKNTPELSPLVMSKAGFYSVADPDHLDLVRCAYCRLEMAEFLADDDPVLLHSEKSAKCPMVLGEIEEEKGLSFGQAPVPLAEMKTFMSTQSLQAVEAARKQSALPAGPSNEVQESYYYGMQEAARYGLPPPAANGSNPVLKRSRRRAKGNLKRAESQAVAEGSRREKRNGHHSRKNEHGKDVTHWQHPAVENSARRNIGTSHAHAHRNRPKAVDHSTHFEAERAPNAPPNRLSVQSTTSNLSMTSVSGVNIFEKSLAWLDDELEAIQASVGVTARAHVFPELADDHSKAGPTRHNGSEYTSLESNGRANGIGSGQISEWEYRSANGNILDSPRNHR